MDTRRLVIAAATAGLILAGGCRPEPALTLKGTFSLRDSVDPVGQVDANCDDLRERYGYYTVKAVASGTGRIVGEGFATIEVKELFSMPAGDPRDPETRSKVYCSVKGSFSFLVSEEDSYDVVGPCKATGVTLEDVRNPDYSIRLPC